MKKYSARRRAILSLAVFGVVGSVKALMIEFGLILLASGIIVGSLYYLSVSVTNPANQQEQQLVQQYGPVGGVVQDDTSGTGTTVALVGWEIGVATLPEETVAPFFNPSDTSNGSFTFQYGLSYDTNFNLSPWVGSPPVFVSNSTSVQSNDAGVTCNTLYYSTNSAMFTVSAHGLTWCFSGTDLANGVYSQYWIQPQTVVIERTTDFVNWTSIFTNNIGLNTLESFTDPDPAPPSAAFYRVAFGP